MRSSAHSAAVAVACLFALLPHPHSAVGDVPKEGGLVGEEAAGEEVKTPAATFGDVIERVRTIAADPQWQRQGWRDDLVEPYLQHLIAKVKQETGREDLALPVPAAFKGLRPEAVDGELGRVNGAIVVAGKDVSVGFAERSVILADGNAAVGFATDCVVVARGAVEIAHGSGNVVLGGHFVHVSHDGNHHPDANAPRASLLMSGGVLDVSHARGSVCAAPDLLSISHANDCVYLNSPQRRISHQEASIEANAEGVEFAKPRDKHPLAGQVTLKWLVPRKGAVFTFGGKRYVADVGQPIVDEAGNAVAELEGWVVSYVGDEFVMFTKGKEDVGIYHQRS